MKSIIRQSLALLVILAAVTHARAESIQDRRIDVDGDSRRLYDVMLESKVDQNALRKALEYLDANSAKFANQNYLTLIDYSKPSDEERFYLFNLKTGKYVVHLVAHGKGSGGLEAERFSNREGSNQTSLGFFRTKGTYIGKHGRSLILEGLEKTNDNAEDRRIVIHAAGSIRMKLKGRTVNVPYVSDEFVDLQGRLGRSEGCPALDPEVAQDVITKIMGGSLIYSFAD